MLIFCNSVSINASSSGMLQRGYEMLRKLEVSGWTKPNNRWKKIDHIMPFAASMNKSSFIVNSRLCLFADDIIGNDLFVLISLTLLSFFLPSFASVLIFGACTSKAVIKEKYKKKTKSQFKSIFL